LAYSFVSSPNGFPGHFCHISFARCFCRNKIIRRAAALRPADPEENGQGAEPFAIRKRWKKRPAISI